MDKKYQVFVSSTFRDLVDERNAVSKAILDLDQIPSGMEMFQASDQGQLKYIKQIIDQCDYYVLVIAGKYGSVDDQGVSYTEREYDYATENGKPVLAFLKKDDGKVLLDDVEIDSVRKERLSNFIGKVSADRMIKYWANRDELSVAVAMSLIKAIKDTPQVGWVRADQVADDQAIRRINALQEENEKLRASISSQKPAIIQVSNIASMDDTYSLSYRYSTGYGSTRREYSSLVSLTWREIATSILPYLNNTAWQFSISSNLTSYINKKQSKRLSNVTFEVSDIATIAIQLEQYGLITRSVAKDDKSVRRPIIQATKAGIEFGIRALAVTAPTETAE